MLVTTSVDGPSGALGRRLGTYTPTRDDRTSFRAQFEFALFDDKENVDPNADGPKRATNGKRRRRESGVKTPCTPSRPPLADITRQFTTPGKLTPGRHVIGRGSTPPPSEEGPCVGVRLFTTNDCVDTSRDVDAKRASVRHVR